MVKGREEDRRYWIEYGEYEAEYGDCECSGECNCIDELQLCVWLKEEVALFRIHRGQCVVIRQSWETEEGWVKVIYSYRWVDGGIEIGMGVEELDCEGRGRRSKSWLWPIDGARVMIGSFIDPTLREEYEIEED